MFADPLRGPVPGESQADQATFHPSPFVGLETDGTLYIVAHRSEMGNGSRTTLPRVVADEMDADWDRVKILQAIGDPRYGSQETGAAHSILGFFQTMREIGATARLMLIQAAASEWSVRVSECDCSLHTVVHRPTRREKSFGELALAASHFPIPDKQQLRLKSTAEWRYIGKDASLYDLHDICTSKAVYGIDAHVDGMVYASIERPPVLGGKVKSYDDEDALRVPGVRQTIQIEHFTPPHGFQPLGGVAVIADNTWAAFQGRKKLHTVWEHGANASYNSGDFKKQLQEAARQPGRVVREQGDVNSEFSKAGKLVEAEYYVPHLAHATMEPPVALADFRDGKLPPGYPRKIRKAFRK